MPRPCAGVVLSFLRSSLGLLEALLRYWKRRGLARQPRELVRPEFFVGGRLLPHGAGRSPQKLDILDVHKDSLPSRVVQSHVRAQQKTLPRLSQLVFHFGHRSRSEEEADALGIRPWRTGPSGKTPRARLPVRQLFRSYDAYISLYKAVIQPGRFQNERRTSCWARSGVEKGLRA